MLFEASQDLGNYQEELDLLFLPVTDYSHLQATAMKLSKRTNARSNFFETGNCLLAYPKNTITGDRDVIVMFLPEIC